MHSRCCWPPESAPPGVPSRFFTSFHSPARSRQSLDDARPRAPRPRCAHARQLQAGRARCRRCSSPGTGSASGTPCRSAADLGRPTACRGRCRRRRAGSSPASEAPGTSSCIRLRMRRNVDLPQPDGPMSAVTCAGPACRATRGRAPCGRRTRRSRRARRSMLAALARRRCVVLASSRSAWSARRSGVSHVMRSSFAESAALEPADRGRDRRPPMIRAMTNRTSTITSSTTAPVHARSICASGRRADEPVDEERQAVLRARRTGSQFMTNAPPAVSSSGAVSPMARATPRMTAVHEPGARGRQHDVPGHAPLGAAERERRLRAGRRARGAARPRRCG